MLLVDDLLMAPFKGLTFVFRQIHEAVEKELYDEAVIKQQLLELQMRYEQGEIPKEAFAAAEADLFARLRVARERRREALDAVHTAESDVVVETYAADDVDLLPGARRP
jgi:hypothetical protein